ncbi:MAG: OmpA family protein [Minicystis sp.]
MTSHRPRHRLRSLTTAAALAAASLPAAAEAQVYSTPPLALDKFDPAPAGDRMFGVQSPYVAGHLVPHVMLLADYAHNPLVIRSLPGENNLGIVVSSQLFLHLNGGLALWNRVYLNVDIPVALSQSGESPNIAGFGTFPSPNNAQFGDVRFGARVRLFGEYDDPFQLAVGGYVWAPTGVSSPGSYVSDGKVRGLPQIIAGGRTNRLVYSAAIGPQIRPAQQYVSVGQGTMFEWGAGIGVLLLDGRNLQLGAEMSGALTFRDVQKRTNNAELLFDVRYRVGDLEVGAGVGPGLASGLGSPDVRGVLMIAYSPEVKRDRDGDGIEDKLDACPDVKGLPSQDPKKHGCPVVDRDKDGVPDEEDACPDVAGVKSCEPHKNGCPSDRDNDHILDAQDACPDVAGLASPDPRKNGCPADADCDGDGVPNAEDACPAVKGPPSPDPKKNGCPQDRDEDGVPDAEDACPDHPGPKSSDPKRNGCPQVRVEESEVFILDQVEFDVDRATIKKVSDPLLDNVASVLKRHPEITKLEVQGHTDNTGGAFHNKQLSQARAESVIKALVARGIARPRLTGKGYGQEKPIADNGTDEGRQKNRRVQFVILGRSK